MCVTSGLFAQVSDDFSDGDFIQNPKWDGDDSLFIVNSNNELQLADSNVSKSSAYLVTESQSINKATWEFKFQLDFDPSTSNYAKYYLTSDQKDITGSLKGYYVKIGGASGTVDDISLYSQNGTTSSLIIDGTDGTVAISPSGWVKVTRDSIGNWELFSDTSATKAGYMSEGTALDISSSASSYTGVFCKYTSSRKNNFKFDSINVTGGFYGDTIKPYVLSYEVLDSFRIKIQFSEKVEHVTALDTGNYWVGLSMTLTRLSADFLTYEGFDSSIVIFTLKEPLGLKLLYHELTIVRIKDFVGNEMNYYQVGFHWPTKTRGQKGDLLINEIFADPTPQIGLPNSEFVEIILTSSNSYDLKDWTFSDPTKTATFPSYILNKGDHLILCSFSDTALFSPFGPVLGLVDFPSLNNSSDVLTLRDSAGTIIDEVAYSDSWYGSSIKADGGYSLELINPNHPCSGASNWIGTDDADGGTPGAKNSVYSIAQDTVKPNLLSVSIISANELKVLFSKALDSASLAQGAYAITNGILVSAVIVPAAYSNEVTLILSSVPSKGILYSLTVSGVSDCFGNTLGVNTTDFGLGEAPKPLEVIINEILPDPDDTKTTVSEYEYVELHNVSNKIISLDSCSFSDLSSSASLAGGVILPGEFLILCETKAVSILNQYGPVLGLGNWPSLNNSSDQISITTSNEVIHQVNYETTWYGDDTKSDGGWALELIDPNNPCEGQFNWKASVNASGGTPGKVNSVKTLNPSESGPNLHRVEVVNDSVIELFFDQVVLYSDWGVVQFSFSNSLSKERILEIRSESVLLALSSSLIERIIYSLEVIGLVNCSGLPIENGQASFGLAEKGELNDLVINEIMIDPYSTATTDYVEIYNRSEKIIDLKNWVICEFDANKDTLDGFKVITSTNRSLVPGEFALISKSSADVIEHYPTNNQKTFIQISTMPSYPNDEGTVVLLNDSGLIIDRVNYLDDWHHVSIKNVDGIALERLDYERETQNEGNWHSAAKSVDYGTPGLPNSQFFPAADFNDQVTLEPETFSPDNDGFDDVLNINYEFDQPGYVASVTVYDAEGREVKQLVNNELLAIQGTFTWDGTTNEQTAASTGIYILFFEVFDEKGKTSKFKKVCVLATKL